MAIKMAHDLQVPKKEEEKHIGITGVDKEKELEEETIEKRPESTKCDGCFRKQFTEIVAVYLCFVCEMYVCVSCLKNHEFHEVMYVGLERTETESEGLGKESKRIKLEETSESKVTKKKREGIDKEMKRTIAEKLWEDVKNENHVEREEKFQTYNIRVYDRVKVKDAMDKWDCYITGMCVTDMGWVVCDCYNHCLKIFERGNNTMQRYIRLAGSRPWDITKLQMKHSSAESASTSSDILVTGQAESNKECLVAVTSQHDCKILFLDLGAKPALTFKVIKTEREFYGISFYDHRIFTVCKDDFVSVYIKTVDGDTLKILYTDISFNLFSSRIAVIWGRIFITDLDNNRVHCRNFQGEVISDTTIEISAPKGICVDSDSNLYICSSRKNNVYKVDFHLTNSRLVIDRNTDYLERLFNLCWYNDKLYISHVGPKFRNFVTVIGLL